MKIMHIVIMTMLLFFTTRDCLFAMDKNMMMRQCVGIFVGGAVGGVVAPILATPIIYQYMNSTMGPETPSNNKYQRGEVAVYSAIVYTAIPGAIAGAYLGARLASGKL